MGSVLKRLDMTHIETVPKLTVFKSILIEITTTELRLDTRISPSSQQDSFIYLHFQKAWPPEFNLSYSPLSVKRLVTE
jgi:hypothetical protein